MASSGGPFLRRQEHTPCQGSKPDLPLSLFAFGIFVFALSYPHATAGDAKRFIRATTSQSIVDRMLSAIGLDSAKIGRSYAVLVSVSMYPSLGDDGKLDPAKADMDLMQDYLTKTEVFDEVIRLENDDVTYDNLRTVLQGYLPNKLRGSKRSRFLFAYSGHGFNADDEGYVLQSSATSLADKEHAIDLQTLKTLIEKSVKPAYNSVILLNACYAGAFLQVSPFGVQEDAANDGPGAYVIAAGGKREPTWHLANVGKGSVFFEILGKGLLGSADTYPAGGDGLITIYELFQYTRSEIRRVTGNRQTPVMRELYLQSQPGNFPFIRREKRVQTAALEDHVKLGTYFGGKGEHTKIERFAARSPTISRGESSQLEWSSSNAVTCSIDDTEGLAPSSTLNVSPGATRDYILKCDGPGGEETATTHVDVQAVARIKYFQTEQVSVQPGDSATLRWQAENATSCDIDGQEVPSVGSIEVPVPQTSTFVLTCSAPEGSATAQVKVNAIPPVRIAKFEGIPREIAEGDDATLRWRAQNATSCSLDGGDFSDQPVPTTSGSETASPSRSTTYTLTCSGQNKETATATTRIRVRKRACCDGLGTRRCEIIINPGSIGSPCVCLGLGSGVTC